MMVVGFFGCFGAVRESQCLLASVNGNMQTQSVLFFKHIVNLIIIFPLCSAVLCLPPDNIWSRNCGWCVWIYKQRAGILLSYCCCHLNLFVLILNFCHYQIVEDVQSFYSNSLTDASSYNETAITYIYHKTVLFDFNFLSSVDTP